MTIEDLYRYYGSICASAEAIGVRRQAISLWRTRGFIPYRQQQHIEKITKGALKASERPKASKIERKFHFDDYEFGLCEVLKLEFTDDLPVRITYRHPHSKKNLVSYEPEKLILNDKAIEEIKQLISNH